MLKINDICVVILDKGPEKHKVVIGDNVLVVSILKEDDFPIRCITDDYEEEYFRRCELEKIGELLTD